MIEPGDNSPDEKGQPGYRQAALFGLCPRCGERTLFATLARVAGTCSACGLQLAALERGGRAAGLITIVVAASLISVAIGVETVLRPPIVLQALFWAPVTVGAVLVALRFFKAYMVMVSYQRQAGREEDDEQ